MAHDMDLSSLGSQVSRVMPLLQLPNGVLQHGVTNWLSLSDFASLGVTNKELKSVVEIALKGLTKWCSTDQREVSHMKAARLFKFLAKHSPNLTYISCCFAADRLYGGSLLESSLSSLVAATTRLTHLTLLNLDVTDVVLQALANKCPQLQHIAIGRTENNAFGNFVSNEGLAALAEKCQRLSSLCLFRCYSCSDAGLRELVARGRQITSLVLHSCPQVTAAGLVTFIESTPGLQELDVLLPDGGAGGSAVDFNTCFALAANCGNLRVLRLSEELVAGSILDDGCMSLVARGCSRLQELELVQVEVSDAFLTCLATYCTGLTSLRLEQTYAGDVGVYRVLAACPHLKTLRVAGCSAHSWMLPAEFMFAGLSVGGFTRLRQIATNKPVFGGNITQLDLSCLALETVEVLEAAAMDVAGVPVPVISNTAALVSSAAAAASSSSDEQNEQDGSQPATADPWHASILPEAWCNRLTSLSLDWLKVDGQTLQAPLELTLSHCSSLTRLSLVGYQGNVDRLLAAVAAAAGASITHLNLQHSQVSDAGITTVVEAFHKLVSLYLSCCRNVGDQGLQQLLQMTSLTELDLFNTPCVSASAVANLARRLPGLQHLYIGHNTSALHRSPAPATAMGYINEGCTGTRYPGTNSSVWSAVNEAVVARSGLRLTVICRNPSQESEFEKQTLAALMAKHKDPTDNSICSGRHSSTVR